MSLELTSVHPQTVVGRLTSHFSRATWKGIASASVWQIANYCIPLLTFPYLARILGVGGFGVLGIGAAVSGYALLLTDWGFALSGTQAVAQARNDPEKINRIIWSTILAKALLGTLSSAAIVAGAMFLVHDASLRAVLIISTLAVLGSVCGVDWALRGVEQLGKFATASVAGRLAAVPLVFLLVHRSSQVPEAAFATTAGGLIATGIALVMARRIGILRQPAMSLSDAVTQIRDGTHIFLSTAMISLYTNCLAIVLGISAGTQQVGLYSGANKIRSAVHGMLSPISMVSYPRMSYLAGSDRERAREVALRILHAQGIIAFVLSAGLCICAPLAVRILLGRGFEDTIVVLQILSWLIFIIGLSNVLGVMIMLPFGLKREFTICITAGSVIGFGLAVPFSHYWGAVGASVAAVLAEIAVTASMYCILAYRLSWFRAFERNR